MSTEKPVNKSVRSFFWDPQNPSLLTINDVAKDNLTQYPLSADTGVSCNQHEFAALLKIISAHEDFYDSTRPSELDDMQRIKVLSKKYRDAIRECRNEWGEHVVDDQDNFNLDLLMFVYAVIHLSDIYLLSDDLDKPGSVTADTVRYLRIHHDIDKIDNLDSDMLESEYPEQCEGYWRYLLSLVLRGCLEEAWNVLSAHSLHAKVRAFDADVDPEFAAKAHEIRVSFLQIKELLLLAPIPGGRTDEFDEEENTNEIEDIGDTYTMDDIDLAATDYKFWENDNSYGDYPISFSPEVAMRKLRRWREHVESVRVSSPLAHQIPEIDNLLAVLTGDFTGVTFVSWAQQFCAELLYKAPDLRPMNCSNRARKIMMDFDDVKDAIISIMQREAGKAIEQIYLFGGGSGAALSSTLMSLLYNLFVESRTIPVESATRYIEFLCKAASHIISSLAESNADMGAQVAVRLLLPYSEETEVVAAIANILEHYTPSSDQFARTMVEYCTPLIKKKSMQILQGCTGILLHVHRLHMKQNNAAAATMVLLDGIGLEVLLLPEPNLGSCYRTLATECHKLSLRILQHLAGTSPLELAEGMTARLMSQTISQRPLETEKIPVATQLVRVVNIDDLMKEAAANTGTDQKIGKEIVDCLEESKDRTVGVTGASTRMSIHWPLLQIAQKLLQNNSSVAFVSEKDVAFDTHGISLLMQRLAQLTTPELRPEAEREARAMQESFQKALAQAYVAENAKKSRAADHWNTNTKVADKIRTVDLYKYDSGVQDRTVQALLDL